MGEFNLLDEPWISVMTNSRGDTAEVSIIELLSNSEEYIDLAGDSVTQDFAVFRTLLAILHTVFSRYNANGDEYDQIEVDEKMKQINEDIDDIEDYAQELMDTWEDLWESKSFPEVLFDYLNVWHDRFFLFDEEFPFYQVTANDITPDKISKTKPSSISAKMMNRLVSESNNKTALFSPKIESQKEILSAPEIARWLLTFQGYSGLSDKVIFGTDKYKASKGWLFDIGGVLVKGKNLFETLMLNLVLVHPNESLIGENQSPSWEYSSDMWLERTFSSVDIDNLAELYTNWSRAVYIEPGVDLSKPFSFAVVKVPEINHVDHLLEPMTTWRFNQSGENKDKVTPRKHQPEQAMWRSFGLITMPYNIDQNHYQPAIMQWLEKIKTVIGDFNIQIQSVSMKDDGNATSWMPAGEIYDELIINDLVLTDTKDEGWIIRINGVVDYTKSAIDRTYRTFMNDIVKIRGFNSNAEYVNQQVETLYYDIDQPFKEWLASIRVTDTKAEAVEKWKKILTKIVIEHAELALKNANNRDYVGIKKEIKNQEVQENIITAYNRFRYFLNRE